MLEPFVLNNLASVDESKLAWEPFRDGVEVSWVYRNGDHGPAAAFLRYQPGAGIPFHRHPGYEHIIFLRGSQTDDRGRVGAGSIVINPPGMTHKVVSEDGCLVLIFWERPVQVIHPEDRSS